MYKVYTSRQHLRGQQRTQIIERPAQHVKHETSSNAQQHPPLSYLGLYVYNTTASKFMNSKFLASFEDYQQHRTSRCVRRAKCAANTAPIHLPTLIEGARTQNPKYLNSPLGQLCHRTLCRGQWRTMLGCVSSMCQSSWIFAPGRSQVGACRCESFPYSLPHGTTLMLCAKETVCLVGIRGRESFVGCVPGWRRALNVSSLGCGSIVTRTALLRKNKTSAAFKTHRRARPQQSVTRRPRPTRDGVQKHKIH